ncbi:hypothetical protein LINGRAHAP2_LOCUS31960 [Linum grandiflorum]
MDLTVMAMSVPTNSFIILGGGPFLSYRPEQYCRSAVQKFFCNLEVLSSSPFQAQTVIDGHSVLLTNEILSETLIVPINGVLLATESEVRAHGFNFEEAGRALCLTAPDQPTNFLALHLTEDLRVFHWFISRIFLPRSYSWDESQLCTTNECTTSTTKHICPHKTRG